MLRTEEKMKAWMKLATYVDYDNLDENEEEEEEPNKEEIDAKRKIFEKEAKKEIQQKFVDKIGIRIDYIKQGKGTSTNGNSAICFPKKVYNMYQSFIIVPWIQTIIVHLKESCHEVIRLCYNSGSNLET